MNDRSSIFAAVLIGITTSAPVFIMGFIVGGKYGGDIVRQQAVDRGAAEYYAKNAKFRWIEPYEDEVPK